MDEQAAQAAAPLVAPDEALDAAVVVDQVPDLDALRLDEERAREADERARAEADAAAELARQRAERLAAEQATAQAAAEEQSRKQAERRRERLAELVAEIEAAVADEDLRSANHRHTLVQREWRDLTSSLEAPDESLAAKIRRGRFPSDCA